MVRKMLRLRLGTYVAGATLAIVPVLAAACGGTTASAGPGATVPQAASTTTPADPYAIPSPITAAYVQRVLNELDSINADAMRIVLTDRSLVPDAARRIRAVNTSASFSQQSMILLNQIDAGLTNYRVPPGAIRDVVLSVISGNSSCIFATVTRDYSALEKTPEKSPTTYVALRPRGPEDDPTNVNPTPWVIDFLGYNRSGAPVANSCQP
jgi:hypothetical protein